MDLTQISSDLSLFENGCTGSNQSADHGFSNRSPKRRLCFVLPSESKENTITSLASARRRPVIDLLSSPNTVNDLILASVDDTLYDLFGPRGRDIIFDHIARNHSFAREDIPVHLDEFLKLLSEAFSTGSETVARTILRRLYSKLGWKFTVIPGLRFDDYIVEVKARIAQDLFEKSKIKHAEDLGKPQSH